MTSKPPHDPRPDLSTVSTTHLLDELVARHDSTVILTQRQFSPDNESNDVRAAGSYPTLLGMAHYFCHWCERRMWQVAGEDDEEDDDAGMEP